MTSLVGVDRMPDWVRDLSGIDRPNYLDVFAMTTAVPATAEAWARAMFGDRADLGERAIWTGLLGLHVARGTSADHVAGWRIGLRRDDAVRLETGSRSLRANLIVVRDADAVSLATVMEYRRPLRGAVWQRLSAVHRRLTPGLIRQAAEALAPNPELSR